MDEYDIEKENSFSRHQLQNRIPKKIDELLSLMGERKDRLEGWHASLFIKLLLSLRRVCHDLLGTMDQDALPAAAWNARNLLELWIWIKYCSLSPDNARRFYEDSLRDFQGLVNCLSKMHELTGQRYELEESARDHLTAIAFAKLGLESIDARYTKVSEAAKIAGLDNWYYPINSFLSKFAHPTAGLVIGVMQNEKLHELQSSFTTEGLYFAGQCVIVLAESIQCL